MGAIWREYCLLVFVLGNLENQVSNKKANVVSSYLRSNKKTRSKKKKLRRTFLGMNVSDPS